MRMTPSIHVAYTRHGRPTGRLIAKMLGAKSWGIRPPNYDPDVLIRWGSRRLFQDINPRVILNTPETIDNASHKFKCLSQLKNVGLNTIPHSTSYSRMMGNYDYIFGRSFYGSGGRDIKIYHYNDVPPEAGRHDWYSGYIRSPREYRLHVVKDKIVRIQGKYQDNPDADSYGGMVRNYANGYRFRTPRQQLRTNRVRAAITAISTLGLDFGAIDVIVDGNYYYIIEVNTAPSCSPLTAKCYVGALALELEARSEGEWKIPTEILYDENPEDNDEDDWL